jgi:hypothetical protein
MGAEPPPAGAELLSSRGPSTAGADRAEAPRRHWYGWQTLVVDSIPLLGLALTAAGSSHGDEREELVVAFSAAYFVGGPIVHMAHGQFGKAVLSLGIRSAGPLLIVAGNQDALQDTSGGAALIVIGVLAIPTAIAVDAAAIAREDVVKDESASILQRVGIAPWVDPKRGIAGLSLGFSL